MDLEIKDYKPKQKRNRGVKNKSNPTSRLNFKNEKFIYLNKYFTNVIDNVKFIGSKVDSCFSKINELEKKGIVSSDAHDKICEDICYAIELAICVVSNCPNTQILIK